MQNQKDTAKFNPENLPNLLISYNLIYMAL